MSYRPKSPSEGRTKVETMVAIAKLASLIAITGAALAIPHAITNFARAMMALYLGN